jgi:hypothetical protein
LNVARNVAKSDFSGFALLSPIAIKSLALAWLPGPDSNQSYRPWCAPAQLRLPRAKE